jgi:hypothetical protein
MGLLVGFDAFLAEVWPADAVRYRLLTTLIGLTHAPGSLPDCFSTSLPKSITGC